jgi:hypothetical protein
MSRRVQFRDQVQQYQDQDRVLSDLRRLRASYVKILYELTDRLRHDTGFFKRRQIKYLISLKIYQIKQVDERIHAILIRSLLSNKEPRYFGP